MKFFDLSQPIWQAIGKAGSIMLLSVLWILTSLPIITIGAATIALNAKTADVLFGSDQGLIKGYMDIFCKNIKKVMRTWIGSVLVFIILFLDMSFLSDKTGSIVTLTKLLLFMISFFMIGFLEAIFIIGNKFQESEKELIKSGIMFTLRYFPKLMALFGILLVLFWFVFSDAMIFVPFFPGICSWLTWCIFKNVR